MQLSIFLIVLQNYGKVNNNVAGWDIGQEDVKICAKNFSENGEIEAAGHPLSRPLYLPPPCVWMLWAAGMSYCA